jgi:hypothetical protein
MSFNGIVMSLNENLFFALLFFTILIQEIDQITKL